MNSAMGNELQRARYVQDMFTSISARYDLMNRLMTFGQDIRWRKEVIHRAWLPPGGRLLDLGSGTGDLAREALRQSPDCRVVAADFTLQMMRTGKNRLERHPSRQPSPLWSAADALQLPFPDGSFDAVVSGFLMRNVVNREQALIEQLRVLAPGGRIVILDTTRPARSLLSPLIHLHMHVIIPLLGKWIAGQPEAYTYLPESTDQFLQAEQLAAAMAAAGFQQIGFHRLMFGTAAIHWGCKAGV
jgi:demethylmenaquinone methyltransferase/2-methoxy-6-polyprenyl-1,4-benzoquinol methylase